MLGNFVLTPGATFKRWIHDYMKRHDLSYLTIDNIIKLLTDNLGKPTPDPEKLLSITRRFFFHQRSMCFFFLYIPPFFWPKELPVNIINKMQVDRLTLATNSPSVASRRLNLTALLRQMAMVTLNNYFSVPTPAHAPPVWVIFPSYATIFSLLVPGNFAPSSIIQLNQIQRILNTRRKFVNSYIITLLPPWFHFYAWLLKRVASGPKYFLCNQTQNCGHGLFVVTF